jgi:hypothetical protein
MPEQIDKYIAIEKNKLAGGGAWLWLLDIAIEGEDTIYLVNNIENVTYQGRFIRCNFEMEAYDKSEPGRLSEVNLNISNTDLVAACCPTSTPTTAFGATITARRSTRISQYRHVRQGRGLPVIAPRSARNGLRSSSPRVP